MPSVRWADIPELSARDRRCRPAWQQYWQQSPPDRADPRPSAFQPGHIPSCYRSCECSALSPVATLSSADGRCCCCHRCCQLGVGRPVASRPAPCRGWPASGPGRLRPGPWFLTGVSAETPGSSDFACTFTRHFSPVLVALRVQSCLRLEGRTRTLSGPSPDPRAARTFVLSVCCVPSPLADLTELHYQLGILCRPGFRRAGRTCPMLTPAGSAL